MQALTKGLVAGAVGLSVLVPAGIAIADDDDDSWRHDPISTENQRQDHWRVQDLMHDGMQVVIDEACPGVGPARSPGGDDRPAMPNDDRPATPNDDRPGMPNDDRPAMPNGRPGTHDDRPAMPNDDQAGWHDERPGPVGDHHRMGR